MTKLRAACSPEAALIEIKDRIGWAAIAALCGKSERTALRWSDPDDVGELSLKDACRLDLAWIAGGGAGTPPLEAWYCLQRQLYVARATEAMARRELHHGELVAFATRETAEALSAQMIAALPGSTKRCRARADRETAEAIAALALVMRDEPAATARGAA